MNIFSWYCDVRQIEASGWRAARKPWTKQLNPELQETGIMARGSSRRCCINIWNLEEAQIRHIKKWDQRSIWCWKIKKVWARMGKKVWRKAMRKNTNKMSCILTVLCSFSVSAICIVGTSPNSNRWEHPKSSVLTTKTCHPWCSVVSLPPSSSISEPPLILKPIHKWLWPPPWSQLSPPVPSVHPQFLWYCCVYICVHCLLFPCINVDQVRCSGSAHQLRPALCLSVHQRAGIL